MSQDDEFLGVAVFLSGIIAIGYFVAIPAYQSVFMTTGYYRMKSCVYNNTEESCYSSLAKAGISKGRQFVVLKPLEGEPVKLSDCAVFSRSDWSCKEYRQNGDGPLASAKFYEAYTEQDSLDPIWLIQYLYRWGKDDWNGCYTGPKGKTVKADPNACTLASNRIRYPALFGTK